MSHLETLIRQAAPPVTRDPNAFLAALDVSSQSAVRSRLARRGRRRQLRWTIAASVGVFALGGTTAAAAVAGTQNMWWSAPHQVVLEATPEPTDAGPIASVSYILAAEFAAGVDGESADAKRAFELAQGWLVGHPIVVDVPADAQNLTDAEQARSGAEGWQPRTSLTVKAIQASRGAIDAAVADRLESLRDELGVYLRDHGVDPSLVIVVSDGGVFEVAP